jgi:hypothetical protein
MKIPALPGLLVCLCMNATAQDPDLLSSLDSTAAREPVTGAFYSSRVINGHSMEMIGKGVLDFRILHRFGRINLGPREMFGLDQARMRLGFDYGLGKNVTIGIGRSTLQKEVDGFIKTRLVQQSTGIKAAPVSVLLIGGITVQTVKRPDSISLSDKSAYYLQAVIGRKISDAFSLQLSPTWLHLNRTTINDDNNILALGTGARYKLSKRLALVVDYYYVFNGLPEDILYNPLSIGLDVFTGGHVFQLHFSNTNGMNERAFIAETIYGWDNWDIMFGFNLSRVFTLGKKRNASAW